MNDDLVPKLHYRPPDGWLGDVHPLFRHGRWHIYALQVPLEPLRAGLSRVHSIDVVGTDLLRWEKNAIRNEDLYRTWWAIANIEVGGRIYSFYNGSQGFELSVSTDGKTWKPHPQNPLVAYPTDLLECRDPFVFHDAASNRYYMIVAGKKRNLPHDRAGLYLYATSTDLVRWTPLKPLYDPGDIGVPECPDLFRMGNHYYLIGSWGTDRVGQGRYRIGDRPEGPWRVPEIDTLDGTEIMAPNTGFDGRRRLFFGWIPTYQGRQDFAPYEWGGHLAFPREVYAGDDGALYLRLPDEFLALRDKAYRPETSACQILVGNWKLHDESLELPEGDARGEFWLPGEHKRFEIEATLTFSGKCSEAGVVFRAGSASFPGYAVTVDRHNQRLLLKRHGERERHLVSSAIRIRSNTPLRLRVFVDGDIVEAFLDDRYSIAGRAHVNSGMHQIGFYAEGGACRVERPTVYTLKPIYTAPPPEPIDLTPAPNPTRSRGGSVLFPRPGANVYTPFHPVLNFAGSFTLECRIKVTPRTGGFKSNLIVKGDPPAGYEYGLNLTNGRALELYFKSRSGYEGLVSDRNTVSEEGKWMHVAGVVDMENKEMRLYRNGRKIAAKAITDAALDTSGRGALRLGCAAGLPHPEPFYGLIDEVRIWACARTDEQIRASQQRPLKPDDREGLIVYWDFDNPRPDIGSGRRPQFPNRAASHTDLSASLFDGAMMQPENSVRLRAR
ncbi:MAG: LamG-like jellyroll fold domain-containing protein [Chloroherpetonaceae bacterium]|nr:LamG-like jellyroll fold domain-containing protein [Chloroherpetonaceae bacterium]